MLLGQTTVADPGGAKDRLPSTVVPGTQGPPHSVSGAQSSAHLMLAHPSCVALTLGGRFDETSCVT